MRKMKRSKGSNLSANRALLLKDMLKGEDLSKLDSREVVLVDKAILYLQVRQRLHDSRTKKKQLLQRIMDKLQNEDSTEYRIALRTREAKAVFTQIDNVSLQTFRRECSIVVPHGIHVFSRIHKCVKSVRCQSHV